MNRAPYLSSMLDLGKVVEREAYDVVRGLIAGPKPTWKILGVRRDGDVLHLAVEWGRCGKAAYANVEIGLAGGLTMRSAQAESAEAARAALDQPEGGR